MQQPEYVLGVVIMSIACLVLIVLSVRQFLARRTDYRYSRWLLLLWSGGCLLAAFGDYAGLWDEPEHQSALSQRLALASLAAFAGAIAATLAYRTKAKKPIK